MSNNAIYLSELVGHLGYDYSNKLKSWLQHNLKNKFDKFVFNDNDGFKVKENAKTLVDNLCILYGFKDVFGRINKSFYNDNDFRPYVDLKSGEYKKYIEKNAYMIRKKLITEREYFTNAIANLEKFFSAVQSQNSIDIKVVSLSKLMANVKTSDGIRDFNPTELSCVIELSELRSRIAETPDNAILYRKMAELLHEMGLLEDSLDQINECLELSPDDGVAWAIKAKVLLEQLEEKRSVWKIRNYVSGSSPYVSSMSAASIEWMFADDVLGSDLDKELHTGFVDSAFNALDFWPTQKTIFSCAEYCENESKCPSNNLCKRPLYSTEKLLDCDTAISREWIFFHLIHNIKISEVGRHKSASRLPALIKSFRSTDDNSAFPNLNFFKDSPSPDEKVSFLYKLTLIMKEISLKEHNALLNAFVSDFKNAKEYADNNLKTLTYSPLADALWDFLGPQEYSKMYKLLWKYVKENEKHHDEIIASHSLRVIRAPLDGPTMMFDLYRTRHMLQRWNDEWGPKFPKYSHEDVATAFSKGMIDAHACIESLDGMIDFNLLFLTDSLAKLPFSSRSLIPMIALIDYNMTGSINAKEALDFIANNPSVAEFCFCKDDASRMEMFDEFWNHPKVHPDSQKPIHFFKAIHPICK